MRDPMFRAAIGLIGLMVSCMPVVAAKLDVTALPQTCKDTLAQMQGEKARFGELGRSMQQARKAVKPDAFCQSAREIVTLIKAQSSRLDNCIGELASGSVPQNTATQMLQLKASYRQMLDAAKDPKNDHMHCSLADQ